jgi:hypothetical protein
MAEHDERADELERQADKMQEESERVSGSIGDARDDWEQKQADQTIPGAQGDLKEQLRVDDEDEDENQDGDENDDSDKDDEEDE